MSGYLHFAPTGVPEIDVMLDTLTQAGNSFHHTEGWQDERLGTTGTWLDEIQRIANESAAEVTRLREQLKAANAVCEAVPYAIPCGSPKSKRIWELLQAYRATVSDE